MPQERRPAVRMAGTGPVGHQVRSEPQLGGQSHPEGRSAAEDGVAVYAPGLRRLSGLFLGVRSDFQQQGRSLYLYLELLVYYLYVVRVFGRRSTPCR